MMELMLGGGIALLLGLIIAIMGFAFGARIKRQATFINNPESFAYLTYGKHGNFEHMIACLNREAQKRKQKSNNRTINAIGLASAFVLGGGFFSFSTPGEVQYIDMFVSDDEIAFCDARTNFSDDSFIRIHADAISELSLNAFGRRATRISISLYEKDYMLTADVPSSSSSYNKVTDAFQALKNRIDERNKKELENQEPFAGEVQG